MVGSHSVQHEPKITVEVVFMGTELGYRLNNGQFKVWRLFEDEKWRCRDDLDEMLIVIDDMLKAAKNMAVEAREEQHHEVICDLAVERVQHWHLNITAAVDTTNCQLKVERISKKIAHIDTDIKFLQGCKKAEKIPKGLQIVNPLNSAYSTDHAERLCRRTSCKLLNHLVHQLYSRHRNLEIEIESIVSSCAQNTADQLRDTAKQARQWNYTTYVHIKNKKLETLGISTSSNQASLGTTVETGTTIGESIINLRCINARFISRAHKIVQNIIQAQCNTIHALKTNRNIVSSQQTKEEPSLTMDHSLESVLFLDTRISIKDRHLKTSVYFKPTDNLTMLHFSSFHPKHTKEAIPYGKALHMHRIYSDEEDRDGHLKILKDALIRTGCDAQLIDCQL
eukprot:g41612.t1